MAGPGLIPGRLPDRLCKGLRYLGRHRSLLAGLLVGIPPGLLQAPPRVPVRLPGHLPLQDRNQPLRPPPGVDHGGLPLADALFLDNLAGGLARAFAAPLLALFWLGWQARRPWVMGGALLLQALFIPYIFLVAAPASLLAWLLARLGRDNPPPFPARAAHFVLLGLGAGLVVAMNLQFSAGGYGPLVSAQEMVNHPEFYAHGRYPILPEASLLWEFISPWEFIPPFQEWGPVAGGLTCAGLLALLAAGFRRLDWPAWRQALKPAGYLGLSSLVLYFLARLFLLKLFVPDRYLMYTLNLFTCLFLALGLKTALQVERWPRHLAILVLVAAACLGAWRLHGVGLKDYSAYRAVYAALAETPKDALIAGHPNLMDTIPTFARRRAFATYELAHPWSRDYWANLSPGWWISLRPTTPPTPRKWWPSADGTTSPGSSSMTVISPRPS